MPLDFSRCRLTPFDHQREDTEILVNHPYLFIASQMRTGKTKIVIDATQFLFEAKIINHVLVVAPSPVRNVWYDPVIGELKKHLWEGLNAKVIEYHTATRLWRTGTMQAESLDWVVSNYEFLRSKARVKELQAFCGPKTLLVLDESSFVKNWAAQQTKSCIQLRRLCGRVVELNGTPVYHSPLDLFSQCNILHPSILDCPYITYFKARYAVQENVLSLGGKALLDPRGNAIKKITGWANLDDLQRRLAPYTIRRLQKDCLDLPPKLDPVVLTAALSSETWQIYKDMRDELVVWLKNGNVATSPTAAIRVMRLSQITSGFLGGIEEARTEATTLPAGLLESLDLDDYDTTVDTPDFSGHRNANPEPLQTIQAIGREKLDVLIWKIHQCLEADPCFHVVVWCRFQKELHRMMVEVQQEFGPTFTYGAIYGGQRKDDRLKALSLLKPETSPKTPVFMGGTFGTGSFGLDMTASHTSITLSTDYSPGKFAQSADRVYGPGQTEPIAYFDIIAAGPKGQKTIDHTIVAARMAGEDIATWTAAAWVKALTEN